MKKITLLMMIACLGIFNVTGQTCTVYDAPLPGLAQISGWPHETTGEAYSFQSFMPCDNGYLREYKVYFANIMDSAEDGYLVVFEGTTFPGFTNVSYSQNIGTISYSLPPTTIPAGTYTIPANTVAVVSGTEYSIGIYFPPVAPEVTTREVNIVSGPNVINGTMTNTATGASPGPRACCDQIGTLTMDINNPLSTEDFTSVQFSVYPNPATNVVNIKSIEDIKSAIIYNATGKKLLETTSKQVDVSALATGLYFMHIEDAKGQTAVKRFIKQ